MSAGFGTGRGIHDGQWHDARTYDWVGFADAFEHGEPTHWEGANHGTTYAAGAWTYGMSGAGLLALLRGEHWQEGADAIEAVAREQAARHVIQRPFIDWVYDVEGAGFDVGMMLANVPEHWARLAPVGTGLPGAIRLVIDLRAASGVPASLMFERMKAVAAATLVMEQLGLPVEVIAGAFEPTHKASRVAIAITVNPAGSPLDVSRIVALAHPATFRIGVHRLLELTPSPAVHGDHGGYFNCDSPNADEVADTFGPTAIYLPPMRFDRGMAPTCDALLRMVKRRVGACDALNMIDDAGDAAPEGGAA